MKHIEPPENLPVVPEPPTPTSPIVTEAVSQEDVHFRDAAAGDMVGTTPAEDVAKRAVPAPASRSLQPIISDMTQRKERPIRAPDDLLSVDDIAELLLVSRAAIYRLVSHRQLPHYRLPGGLRFKMADIDAFLESRRADARPPKRYGAQGQR